MGELEAVSAIVKTDGKMKAISLNETDSRVTVAITDGFKAEVAKCADCKILTQIDLVASDFGPALQNKVQQALLQHPDANVVFGNYDDVLVGGAAAAVRSAGKIGKVYVTGSPGYPANVDLMRGNVGQDMASGFSVTWEAWAALDRLNRLFNNDQTPPNNGIGFAAIDRSHNLPQANTQWEPAIDFRSLYRKAWGV
jgi:ribose transport system substrate-binding protein